MQRINLSLAALALTGACIGAIWPSERKLPEVPLEQCTAAGGVVRVAGGLVPAPMCIVQTPDAGKQCTDSSECTGRCTVSDDGEKDLRQGTRANGRCEASNADFGCYAEVRHGRLTGTICVD